jgi:hypothetical protein
LHPTNRAALGDEKIISQPQYLSLKREAPGYAGRFVLDVGQTARLIRSYIKSVKA